MNRFAPLAMLLFYAADVPLSPTTVIEKFSLFGLFVVLLIGWYVQDRKERREDRKAQIERDRIAAKAYSDLVISSSASHEKTMGLVLGVIERNSEVIGSAKDRAMCVWSEEERKMLLQYKQLRESGDERVR